MNPNIQQLFDIAGKSRRTIIGLMSGTSFDGLDVALCEFEGSGRQTRIQLKQFVTKEYAPAFKEDLKAIFAKEQVSLQQVTLLNAYIGSYYAELIKECLSDWQVDASAIDLIASHGQTIFHAPRHHRKPDNYGNATLQIGDADHLAVATGIITLSDFRQKHIAAGGEGAPLAVYGDYLIFSDPHESRLMLNIGGIANFTYLPADDASLYFSTDVGPGNTLMDQFVQKHYPGQYFDRDAEIGKQGVVNETLLAALLDHPFFDASFPKTTGPELFSLDYLQVAIEKSGNVKLADADVIATLARFSAESIIRAVAVSIGTNIGFEVYVSGGGMYNPLVIGHLEAFFGRKLKSTATLDVNPDAKEAVLFALLANEAVAGGAAQYQMPPNWPLVSMGKISFPA
jgi:anhydro-N-acetylmuramic acid kinase